MPRFSPGEKSGARVPVGRDVGTSMAPARLEIQLSSGRSRPLLNVQAYVEVGVVGGGSATRGYTDFNGRIRFDVLSGNRYQLTVSGPGIESKTVMFDIPPEQRFHHEVIDIELRTAGTTAKRAGRVGLRLNPVRARKSAS